VGDCAGSVTPVWTDGRPPGAGGRSWLRFGVIYSRTLAAATDSLLRTFPRSPCGVKGCVLLWHGIEACVTYVVASVVAAQSVCAFVRYRLISGCHDIERSASLLPQCCLTWLFEQPVSAVSIRGPNHSNEHRFSEPRFTTLSLRSAVQPALGNNVTTRVWQLGVKRHRGRRSGRARPTPVPWPAGNGAYIVSTTARRPLPWRRSVYGSNTRNLMPIAVARHTTRVRPISYITALTYRQIRHIGLHISADTECDNNQQ